MSLPDRAGQVLDLFTQKGLGDRPLFFICHSLGGLLAKQVLRKASDALDPRKRKVAAQTRAVLFLATPHAGASLASLLSAFRTLFGATVSMEDLQAHDAHLRDLFDWYRNHAPDLHIQTATYYERRRVKGVLPIVNPTSSHPGVGQDPVGLDEDHLSIAKPREPDAQVCGAAGDLLRRCVLASQPASPDSAASVLPGALTAPHEIVVRLEPGPFARGEAHRTPRELPPAALKFFGREAELKRLSERLWAGLNTAVVGPAGLGKTALAADALAAVVGANAVDLAASPFSDGIVYLDLYTFHGQAEPAWNALANRLGGAELLERRPARERALEACRARRILVVVEGGEEADGTEGRATMPELFSVLSPENRWLLLTRVSTQSAAAESLAIKEALDPAEAADLLDWLTRGRPLDKGVCQAVLELLEGHPLALNWAGNLLAHEEEDPSALASEWAATGLPRLSDPRQAERTLQWVFERSVRGLDDTGRQALAAAGLLAREPFATDSIGAALGRSAGGHDGRKHVGEALKGLVRRGLLRPAEKDHWQFSHVLGYRFARDEDGSDPALRQRLGHWLLAQLETALKADIAGDSAVLPSQLLHHVAALLRADPDQILWDPLAEALLYRVSDRLEDLGRLDLVSRSLSAVEGWLARLPATLAREPRWLRERCGLIVSRGDVLSAQGDLAGALAAYQESLAVSQRLAESDPSNADWQRDLSVSQSKVGDVLLDQGDLAGALASYRETLAVRRRLAESDPSNAGWQRDLSVSHQRIGDVLLDQGDLAGALGAYGESLAVSRRLAESEPSNTGWQRDLSVNQNKVGEVLSAKGDLAGALGAYGESLTVSRRLALSDPSNAGWQRDLSVSQERIGDVLLDQGDLAGALAAYDESLAVRRRLVEADASNAGWQRDLGASKIRVGDVLRAQGDLAGALAAYRESLAVNRLLAESDPSNAGWQRDLSVSQNKVGDLLGDQGDLAGALASYRETLAVRRRLAESDPSNAGWQRDLSFALTQMAQLHEQSGNCSEALPLAEESLKLDERLAALDRSNATWQRDVAVSRALVARLQTGAS
jgi:tetratricopeptide (TPR) repeat protein